MPKKAATNEETTDTAAKKGVEENAKAIKFQEFLMDNNINVFATESTDDEFGTVMFRSRVEAAGQKLPCAVIIDTSIFTIIRTQIAQGVKEEKRAKIKDRINELNAQYKVFKYYMREDGSVYLDICIPADEDTFDGKTVQILLGVLIRHLEENYDDFMERIWAKEG